MTINFGVNLRIESATRVIKERLSIFLLVSLMVLLSAKPGSCNEEEESKKVSFNAGNGISFQFGNTASDNKTLRRFCRILANELGKTFDKEHLRHLPAVGVWTTRVAFAIEDNEIVESIKESSGSRYFDRLVLNKLKRTESVKNPEFAAAVKDVPITLTFTRDLRKNRSLSDRSLYRCMQVDFEILEKQKQARKRVEGGVDLLLYHQTKVEKPL